MNGVTYQGFLYEVQVSVLLTPAVIEHLSELATSHYDGRCKAMAERGGMVYGWMNRVRAERELGEAGEFSIDVTLGFRELDTLCKVLEAEVYVKRLGVEHGVDFRELLSKLKVEQARVQGATP